MNRILPILFLFLCFGFVSFSTANGQTDGEYESVRNALRNPGKVIVLDLSGQRATVLDAQLVECVNMEELILDGMRLEKIPGWIKGLKNLTDISLSNNKLTKLPGWIMKLPRLESIDIRGNDISDDEIENIRHRFEDIDFLTD